MPAKAKVSKGAMKAGKVAMTAQSNPYVRRLIEDEDLRRNIVNAFSAARHAYQRMSNGKGPARAITRDKKVQRDIRLAAEALRAASEQLKGRPKRRRKRRAGPIFLALIATGGLVLAFSEGARKAVLDLVFGSEEEFEYDSTTSPSSTSTV